MLQDDLTPLERRLVECAAAGEELDCAPNGGITNVEFDEIDDWDDRKIRAEVLVALCTGEVPEWSIHPRGGLQLRGCYIAGFVDLFRAQLTEFPIIFNTCYFDGTLMLDNANIFGLAIRSCRVPALYGNGLNCNSSLNLTKTHLTQIWLGGAYFRDIVLLSEAHMVNPGGRAFSGDYMSARVIDLSQARVDGEVSLMNAQLSGDLICEGAHLFNSGGRALIGNAMSVDSVVLSQAQVKGEIELMSAQISNYLLCTNDTYLTNPEGTALTGDNMSVTMAILSQVHVQGRVSLQGAQIRSWLKCNGAHLSNPGGTAFSGNDISARHMDLSQAQVKGDLTLAHAQISGLLDRNIAHLEGEFNLINAKISGYLTCIDARLVNLGDIALYGDGMRVNGLSLIGTQVEGEVSLMNALISNHLLCAGARLYNPEPEEEAFNAYQCQVGGTFNFCLAERAVGKVSLAYAQVGLLEDDLSKWPETIDLVGFSYRSLKNNNLNLSQRLKWLSKSKPFSPDIYSQLAEVYRRTGHEGDAKKVAIEREKKRGQEADLSWGMHTWHSFLGFTVRYGYKPWRALVAFAVLFALGSVLFSLPVAQEVMVSSPHNPSSPQLLVTQSRAAAHTPPERPKSRLRCLISEPQPPTKRSKPSTIPHKGGFIALSKPQSPKAGESHNPWYLPDATEANCQDYPCFTPWVYTLDLLLPIVDLHQEDNWVPASDRQWGLCYEMLTWFLIAAGWILTTAILAGITSVWRKE